MTVRGLINELIKFNPDEEIFFYEEETNDILNITDMGGQNDSPYIFFKKPYIFFKKEREPMTSREAQLLLDKLVLEDKVEGDDATAVIMGMQALERLEHKKGKWIESNDIIISGTCSCCGWNAITMETDVVGMPFCPNCGAEMDGEDKK